MVNCQLTENKSFKFIRIGRISVNIGNSLYFVISFTDFSLLFLVTYNVLHLLFQVVRLECQINVFRN